jgi:hypothetical protein
MRRGVILASLLALLPVFAHAHEVYLKGGGRLSGRILSQTETSVSVDVGPGIITVPMTSVLRIEDTRSVVDEYHERAGALRPGDLGGWLQLGKWATSQGLGTQARTAYERVVSLDPQHTEANLALGRVLVDGRWMSEADSYRARGYVNFEGEWMPPADREATLARRDAAHQADWARLEAERRVRDAEARAAEAEARAREAELAATRYSVGTPVWGGWGYGGYGWPSYGTSRPGPRRGTEAWPPAPLGSWSTFLTGPMPSQPSGARPSAPQGTHAPKPNRPAPPPGEGAAPPPPSGSSRPAAKPVRPR